MKNKGFVLSLDAIIALIFIISLMAAITSLYFFKKSDTSVAEFEMEHYISEDALEVMNKKSLLEESSLGVGELSEDALDLTVLDKIGRYWAECLDFDTRVYISELNSGKSISVCNRNTNADVSKAECNANGTACNITTCHTEKCSIVSCLMNSTSNNFSIDDYGKSYFDDASELSNITLNSTHRIYNCSAAVNLTDYSQTASGVAKFYLTPILNYPSVGFRLKLDDNMIYEDLKIPEDKAKTKSASKRILVGYSPGEAVTGCSTRAQLISIRNKHSAAYLYFGGYEGDGDLTKYLTLPETFSYEDSYIEVSAGSDFDLYINGNPCKCITDHVKTGSCTGDSFSPSGAGLNANLKADLICTFEPGENKIDIKFKGTKKYIGGGYIKVGYVTPILGEEKNLTAGQVTDRFYLTGIEGIINLYSSFYIPGTITSMNAYLHYDSNSTQFLGIGNAEIYNNKSNGTTQVYIPWSNISTSLTAKGYNPAMLSQTTVPLRFGTSNISYFIPGGYGISDTILITDVTGSMNWQMGNTSNGIYRPNCDDPNINASDTSRISVARCVDKQFIDTVLGAEGNRVGLVSYGDGAVKDSYHLSGNATELKSHIESTYTSGSGATCICCAIRQARQMLANVPPITYPYIVKNSVWRYNTSFPSSEPPNDANGSSWKSVNYNDSSWAKDYTIIGFENIPYSPAVNTNIESNSIISYSNYNASSYSLSKGSVSGGSLTDTRILDGASFDISGAGIPGWNLNYYAESTTESTTSSTSFQDKTVLTFTPGSGDYLITASGMIGESSTSYYAEVQLNIDGTTYSINEFMPSGSGTQNYYSFGTHKVITLNASTHNAAIRYRTSNSGAQAKIKEARITAVKISNYSKQESESLSTTTSTTYQDKLTLTFTPPQKGDYLIIASADLSESSTSQSAYAQLTYNGNSIGEMRREPVSSADHFYTFITIRNLTLDTSTQTFKIQYRSISTSATAKIKNARITAIKIENFLYAESESDDKTTSTGYMDKTVLSFTSPSAGDYLIIASAFVKQENTNYRVYTQMNIDDSTYIEKQYRPKDGLDYVPFFALKKINFDNNTHTIKIQYKSIYTSTTSESYIKNARIIAIPLFTAYKTDISLDSQTISYRPKALNTINASIVFKSDVSGKYQMKIYNFNTSTWDLSNCSTSTVSPGVQNNYFCAITKNAENYVNNSAIKISLTGDTANPALTKIDFVKYYLKDAEGNYYFRKNFTVSNASEIVSAKLYVLSDDNAEIYLNGHLIDNDTAKHSQSAEYWNRDYMDVNKSYFVNGTNIVAAKLRNYDNDSAKFDLELSANISTIRKKYIIVMTDGIANRQCSDSNENDTDGINPSDDVTRCGDQFSQHAANDAINDSCKARNQTGSIIYSIGFGPVSSCPEGEATLKGVANCGNGSYYSSSNASQLSIIYSQIAEQIVNSSYHRQTVEVTGAVIKNTLYPDSYIEFNYVPLPFPLRYKEISISEETLKFGDLPPDNNDSTGMPYKTGCFYITGGNKSNVRIIEARVTSYSSDFWTDEVQINTTSNWTSIYSLSGWGNNYSVLGDPYAIGIDPTLIKPGEENCIRIKTGTAPGINNSEGGSPDNKVVYTIALSGSVDYSTPFTKCKGSTLTVWYNYEGNENNRHRTIGYGPDPEDPFDPEIDSIDYQMLQLLNKLNFRTNITSGPPVKLNTRTTDPFISYMCNNTKTVDVDNGTCMLSNSNQYPSNISDDIGDGSCCNPVDIDIDEEDVEFIYISAGSVRSLWGPAVVKLEVWM